MDETLTKNKLDTSKIVWKFDSVDYTEADPNVITTDITQVACKHPIKNLKMSTTPEVEKILVSPLIEKRFESNEVKTCLISPQN